MSSNLPMHYCNIESMIYKFYVRKFYLFGLVQVQNFGLKEKGLDQNKTLNYY